MGVNAKNIINNPTVNVDQVEQVIEDTRLVKQASKLQLWSKAVS